MSNIYIIIIRFLSKKISNEELDTLENWLKKPKNRIEFQELSNIWFTLQKKQKFDEEKAKERFLQFLNNNKQSKFSFLATVMKYVALLIGFSIVFHFLFTLTTKDKKEPVFSKEFKEMETPIQHQAFIKNEKGDVFVLTKTEHKSLKASDGTEIKKEEGEKVTYQAKDKSQEKAVMHQLGVPRGKRIDLILADGTKVWLNSESVLKYPTRFDEKERIVFLEGEAYFEVAKNKEKPFIVITSGLNIHVLGTRFNLYSHRTAKTIDLALAEGRVAVHSKLTTYKKSEPIFVVPNQRIIFDKSSNSVKIEDCDAETYCSWRNGKLQFSKEPFQKLKIRLERWYDITISNENKNLEKLSFSGVFDNEDIIQAMEILKKNTGIRYEKIGEEIRILP